MIPHWDIFEQTSFVVLLKCLFIIKKPLFSVSTSGFAPSFWQIKLLFLVLLFPQFFRRKFKDLCQIILYTEQFII